MTGIRGASVRCAAVGTSIAIKARTAEARAWRGCAGAAKKTRLWNTLDRGIHLAAGPLKAIWTAASEEWKRGEELTGAAIDTGTRRTPIYQRLAVRARVDRKTRAGKRQMAIIGTTTRVLTGIGRTLINGRLTVCAGVANGTHTLKRVESVVAHSTIQTRR